MKKILILGCGLALLLFACKEDTPDNTGGNGNGNGSDDEDPVTVVSLLTGTWDVTDLEIEEVAQSVSNQSKIEFKGDDNYSATLPELSFFPNEGSWALTSNDTKINMADGAHTLDIISGPEGGSLTLSLEHKNFKDDPITYVMNLTKQ